MCKLKILKEITVPAHCEILSVNRGLKGKRCEITEIHGQVNYVLVFKRDE